jgi:isocitrate dehydrogenase
MPDLCTSARLQLMQKQRKAVLQDATVLQTAMIPAQKIARLQLRYDWPALCSESLMARTVCVADGDGIGPEIMAGVLKIIEATKAPIDFQRIEMGAAIYARGLSAGMTDNARALVEATGVLLKGPMETPKGRGVKSINVTARKVWSTYANKRTFQTLPGVETVFSKAGLKIDITMIRENIEDTYGGIEHMLTHDVALCRRLVTRPGSEQVHRYAFELARRNVGGRVTCGHKANIMKLTDGLFLETFYRVARDYPMLQADDMIVDDMAMKLVTRPDQFDFLVLPNLQGDILSDLCAGLVGGLGFAPAANIGKHVSIFEAVHGTAPTLVGKNVANPSALLLSSAMMLRHLGLQAHGNAIDDALLRALALGTRTADFGDAQKSASSTKEFVAAVIGNLEPVVATKPAEFARLPAPVVQAMNASPKGEKEVLVGVDLFVESLETPAALASLCQQALPSEFTLTMISNRGTQVWPGGSTFTECVNQYRIRLEKRHGVDATVPEVLRAAEGIHAIARLCSVEMLLRYGDVPGYSLAQGQ